jgi:CBS domain containing-hemolysin-like protein
MSQLIFTVFFLLLGSAFCSSTEASIFSVSKTKLESLSKKKKSALLALQAKKNIFKSIGSIVILNNLFNIVGTLIAGVIATEVFNKNEFYLAIFSGILTFFVILFGEILPKNFGERFALPYALLTSRYVLWLNFLFSPILWVLDKISKLIFGNQNYIEKISEEEIRVLLDQGKQTKSIEYDEHQLINNVFRMNDKTAKDIMTPRVNIDYLDQKLTLDQQKEKLYNATHSRLPVFEGSHDNIIGFVLSRDALEQMAKDNGNIKPSEISQEILEIKESTRVDTLLIIFQKKRLHIAIVKDDFGGVSGIVTLEDVIEELVGEIVDEKDKVVDMRHIDLEYQA